MLFRSLFPEDLIPLTEMRLPRSMSVPGVACALSFSIGMGVVDTRSVCAQAQAESLLVVTTSGPDILDMHSLEANPPCWTVAWNVYDRLVSFDQTVLADGSASYDHNAIIPELAESWSVSADGCTITFHLRKDAVFHDGTPLTAEDVKWSLDRAVSVGGFPSFQLKSGSLQKPGQFQIIDLHTLKISLPKPDKQCLPVLAMPVASIFNSKLARVHATADDPWAMAWLKTHAAGSGAYRLISWQPGMSAIYHRNDHWCSGSPPALKRIEVREVASADEQLAWLQRGTADVAFPLNAKQVQELQQFSSLKVISTPVENAMWYLGMKTDVPPFDDIRVRQAVAMAVPYEQILCKVMLNHAVPLFNKAVASVQPPGGDKPTSPPPPSTNWPQPTHWRADVEQARKLLQEAGYADGFTTHLAINHHAARPAAGIAALIKESLAHVGIKILIREIAGPDWRSALLRKDLPMVVNHIETWLNTPEHFFYWAYHSQNAVFNTMSYKNPRLDKLVEQARIEADPQQYTKQVREFIHIAHQEVPRIPLFQPLLHAAMSQQVTGYCAWFHGQLDFRQLARISPDGASPVFSGH